MVFLAKRFYKIFQRSMNPSQRHSHFENTIQYWLFSLFIPPPPSCNVHITPVTSKDFPVWTLLSQLFLYHHLDSFCMKLSDFEDWKGILGTGKDFGDRNRTCKFDQILWPMLSSTKIEVISKLKDLPQPGIEPTTSQSKVGSSTTELLRQLLFGWGNW